MVILSYSLIVIATVQQSYSPTVILSYSLSYTPSYSLNTVLYTVLLSHCHAVPTVLLSHCHTVLHAVFLSYCSSLYCQVPTVMHCTITCTWQLCIVLIYYLTVLQCLLLSHYNTIIINHVYMWQDLRKGTISRYSRTFILKRLYLCNHSSYELQTWHEHSSIILLHSLQIAGPAHFRCGRGGRARRSRSKIAVLCLTSAAYRSGQEACSDF